jgi:DNA-binding winged helix-turn-helix (wHTH) protein
MPSHSTPDYQCGELRISPTLGFVSNGEGESIRLGPVNMKVLATLLARPGDMISRSELFEGVWRNQIISDDALTRCVSDIRGQLRKLSGRDDWIETLPKRGYRWTGPVSEALPIQDMPEPPPPASPAPAPHPFRQRALRLAGRGIAYLLALFVMASLMVWAIDRFSGSEVPVVAVLPVTADPSRAAAAVEFDRALSAYLVNLEPIRVLARSAIDSRPTNPFPFFYYEFGARWLIESGLEESDGQTIVSIAIVDARTGIVEMQFSEHIAASKANGELLSGSAREALQEFIKSQTRR